ncbi:MAG TPA: radical SAM protein [Candidatus Bathyarchaeota archaeon]|nr:radical SAM protein [Candidatus Bathyarchaeota archaeon]HEW89927.1 radical SAM protein [Candidatus Bathyarchaeota archaeon]
MVLFLSLSRSSKRKRRMFNCIQVEITSRCFLKCVMCPGPALADKWVARDMDPGVVDKVVESAELANLIYLSGWGEPLLYPGLPELVKRIRTSGAETGFTTNGVLLDRRRAQELVEAGLDLMSISIAGATRETHGSVRVGSDLGQIIDNVKALVALKKRLRTDEPRIVVLYLMLKQNISELPAAVDLAHELGVDELVATNMTYAPTPAQDRMRVFSCGRPEGHGARYAAFVEEARARAGELGLKFRAYPLTMEEVAVCDEDPLHNVFITADGQVGPCVYLNMMLKGPIPRVFCGKALEVERVGFGSLGDGDLTDIWEGEDYVSFRQVFAERLLAVQEPLFLGPTAPGEIYERLKSCPLPSACRTCYKAYGL